MKRRTDPLAPPPLMLWRKEEEDDDPLAAAAAPPPPASTNWWWRAVMLPRGWNASGEDESCPDPAASIAPPPLAPPVAVPLELPPPQLPLLNAWSTDGGWTLMRIAFSVDPDGSRGPKMIF